MMLKTGLKLAFVAYLAVACTKKTELSQSEEKAKEVKMESQKFVYDQELFSQPFKYEKTKAARALFKGLADKKENQIFSPFSLEAVLTFLAVGSKGESLKALEQFLELENQAPMEYLQLIQGSFKHLESFIDPIRDSNPPKVKLGFGIAASQDYPVDEDAVSKVKEELDTFVKSFDFVNKKDEAKEEINRWVEEQTYHKIKNLLPYIDPSTAMILINTLYLKSSWEDPFNESQTAPMDFVSENGGTRSVPTMRKNAKHFSYVDHKQFQAISIPLTIRDMDLWFFRPVSDASNLVQLISETSLSELLKQRRSQKINLFLPKFKIESKLMLVDLLKEKGLEVLTRSPNMDINGFFKEKKDFVVNQVIQGNFFAIDEKGIEAASATALGMRAGGVPKPEEPIELRFDKPFVFVLFQPSTGRIAFIGQVYEP